MSLTATTSPPTSPPTDPYAARERHHNEGQGRRLTAAFEALEAFPVLAETRNRVTRLISAGDAPTGELIDAVEGDVALCVGVLRLANQIDGRVRGRIDSALAAVDVLSPSAVLSIVRHARTCDFFERTAVWHNVPERFRLHALATQRAADRVAAEVDYDARDRLMITALLHDIGKLVLVHAYPGYPRQVHGDAQSPEERVQSERRQLGVDHALVGGVIVRRWGLPVPIAQAVESHHSAHTGGEPAIIRLADMLAHYVAGGAVAAPELLAVARSIELDAGQLREIMYDLPRALGSARPRQLQPNPMSSREVEVLRRLARGMVYKQIASELGLSTSTVRTHLHNIYGKLGAADRARAVLIATERGWI